MANKKIYNKIEKMINDLTLTEGSNTIYSRTNRPLVLMSEDYYKENPEALRAWIDSTYVTKRHSGHFITPEIAVELWGTGAIKANEIEVYSYGSDEYKPFDGMLYENRYNNDELNPIISKYSTGVWTYIEYLNGAKFRYR